MKKREKIMVKTDDGEVELSAWILLPGLYVHRAFGYDDEGKPSAKHFTEGNYWTIYHKSGLVVIHLKSWPCKLKTILQSGKARLEACGLDWTKPGEFFERGLNAETEPYRDAAFALKSRVEAFSGR